MANVKQVKKIKDLVVDTAYLSGEIGQDLAMKWLQETEQLAMDSVKDRKVNPLLVFVSSTGGDILAANTIITQLKEIQRNRKVFTIACTDVSSAAIDIFLEGDLRFVHGAPDMTFHRATTQVTADVPYTAEDHKRSYETILEQDGVLAAHFEKLNIPKSLQRQIEYGQDVVIPASKMYEYGIITNKGTVWEYLRRSYGHNKVARRGAGSRKRVKS